MTEANKIKVVNPANYTDGALLSRDWDIHANGMYALSLPGSDHHRSYILEVMPLRMYRGASCGAPAPAWALEDNFGSDAVADTKLDALVAAEAWVAREKEWRAADIAGARVPAEAALSAEDAAADIPF